MSRFGIAPDGLDSAGNTVRRIFVATDRFIIYAADDEKNASDVCSLHYSLAQPYEQAKELRKRLIPVATEIAWVTDAVCGLKPFHADRRYATQRERAYELMARAMAFAFEDHVEDAMKVLSSLRREVEGQRDSKNRMRYIAATTVSFVLILLAGLAYKATDSNLLGAAIGLGDKVSVAVIDVLLFGALGAFFSVVFDIGRVKVAHSIALAEMLYAGSIRIPVGVIAASVVILLVAGGWLLGSVTGESRAWSLCLFGFLAGFSEMFVPNALKQAEDGASVATPSNGARAANAGAQ